MPSDDLLISLRSKTPVLLSCYDNDEAGRNASKRLQDSFGIVSIQLPEEVKDIAEYFQKYTSIDFQLLLDAGIKKAKKLDLNSFCAPEVIKSGNSIRSKVKFHLSERFEFRLNTVTQQCEILNKANNSVWEKVNVSELRDHLDRHGIYCSLDLIKYVSSGLDFKKKAPLSFKFGA